jgi:hypothetical protein
VSFFSLFFWCSEGIGEARERESECDALVDKVNRLILFYFFPSLEVFFFRVIDTRGVRFI